MGIEALPLKLFGRSEHNITPPVRSLPGGFDGHVSQFPSFTSLRFCVNSSFKPICTQPFDTPRIHVNVLFTRLMLEDTAAARLRCSSISKMEPTRRGSMESPSGFARAASASPPDGNLIRAPLSPSLSRFAGRGTRPCPRGGRGMRASRRTVVVGDRRLSRYSGSDGETPRFGVRNSRGFQRAAAPVGGRLIRCISDAASGTGLSWGGLPEADAPRLKRAGPPGFTRPAEIQRFVFPASFEKR